MFVNSWTGLGELAMDGLVERFRLYRARFTSSLVDHREIDDLRLALQQKHRELEEARAEWRKWEKKMIDRLAQLRMEVAHFRAVREKSDDLAGAILPTSTAAEVALNSYMASLPVDDEELSEKERAQIAEGKAALARGDVMSAAEIALSLRPATSESDTERLPYLPTPGVWVEVVELSSDLSPAHVTPKHQGRVLGAWRPISEIHRDWVWVNFEGRNDSNLCRVRPVPEPSSQP